MDNIFLGRRVKFEDQKFVLKLWEDAGARRDLRLFGISIGWTFIGFVWFSRSEK